MTVTTNNLDGYAVTVQAASAELTPAQPGNTATIPVGNLQVRESGTSVFRPISSDAPLLIHEQPGPSALNGDAIVNDFEAYIPFVPADDYSGTLTYIATAK